MDRNKMKLMGAAAALAAAPALGSAATAEAAPAVPVAHSYAELLEPISNPVARLAAADAQADQARLIEAQYVPIPVPAAVAHHHHHHHHHQQYRRWRHSRAWYLQNGYYWYGGRWVLRPRNHHHHHHHNHDHY